MKLRLAFSICAVALAILCFPQANADEINVTLEYNTTINTFQLFAEVNDTDGAAEGSFGISALRTLVTNIDPASVIIHGPTAVLPNGSAPAQAIGGGNFEILYGQDLSGTVTTGVGNSGSVLLASGDITGNPAAGVDTTPDPDLFTEGLFLSNGSAPFAEATVADATNLSIFGYVADPFGAGDFAGDGIVEGADLTLLLDFWNKPAGPAWIGVRPTPEGANVAGDELTVLLDHWGNNYLGFVGAATIPEPSSMAIALLALMGGLALRRVGRPVV